MPLFYIVMSPPLQSAEFSLSTRPAKETSRAPSTEFIAVSRSSRDTLACVAACLGESCMRSVRALGVMRLPFVFFSHPLGRSFTNCCLWVTLCYCIVGHASKHTRWLIIVRPWIGRLGLMGHACVPCNFMGDGLSFRGIDAPY